jgi:V/A-type H+-transporting ATPase subunit K
MELGMTYAVLGAALAVILSGTGSAIGLRRTGLVISGILRENPERWGSLFLLAFLPATQGLYGFLIAFMVLIMGGLEAGLPTADGLQILLTCLPVAINGLITAPIQGAVSAAAAETVAVRPDQTGRGLMLAAFIEFYAILGMVISFLYIIMAP